jgi:molecular chaperone HtpG
MPKTRRIMEVNPTHPLISNLQKLHDRAPEDNRVHEWIELLYDQALLAEGSPIPDPARFTARMTRLVQDAASAAVSA